MSQKPIVKRPCSNCPFRADGGAIELRPGRLEGIVRGLLDDDMGTFVCHKTLSKKPATCAGAVGLLSKAGRLPVIARLALSWGLLTKEDIEASAAMVVDLDDVASKVEGG